MATTLLDFVDLPMISMPDIKPWSMAPSMQCLAGGHSVTVALPVLDQWRHGSPFMKSSMQAYQGQGSLIFERWTFRHRAVVF